MTCAELLEKKTGWLLISSFQKLSSHQAEDCHILRSFVPPLHIHSLDKENMGNSFLEEKWRRKCVFPPKNQTKDAELGHCFGSLCQMKKLQVLMPFAASLGTEIRAAFNKCHPGLLQITAGQPMSDTHALYDITAVQPIHSKCFSNSSIKFLLS